MNAVTPPLVASNPFATRWVRPGAISYCFPAGENIDLLLQRLCAAGWWGQIVGAHGTGKSTLLATLIPRLQRAGLRTVVHTIRDERPRMPRGWQRQIASLPPTVLVIDGFEQLGRWQRLWVRLNCWFAGRGLLVTAHEPIGLPHLYCTSVSIDTAHRVVEHLTLQRSSPVTDADLASRLAARGGNLREALFDLYDVHERLTRDKRRLCCGRSPTIPADEPCWSIVESV